MIDLKLDTEQIEKNASYCKERGIVIPTFAQLKNPGLIPDKYRKELATIGLWDLHPKNLFRITWKNESVPVGGGFDGVNYLLMPPALTGVRAKIIALCGRWMPTGAHKVGATFGCLVPKLVTGHFDPMRTKAVWPSTGNYCRGGAYVSSLLGCDSIAILPENMSRERFEWLSKVAGEVIATHGCESNVKEIFDKCWEMKRTRNDIHIFNQFEELGNTLWHYEVTGSAFEETLRREMKRGDRYAGAVFSSGSGGTLAAGYYLKERFPKSMLAAAEALQCPTLLYNGFGDHRIEGIGDKHVPWIHDVKNTDMVIGVDDEATIRLLRLFNTPVGRKCLNEAGVAEEVTEQLDCLGISCIANLLASIKLAKYYELTEQDYVVTVFTDSAALYGSRLRELEAERGAYREANAYRDIALLQGIGIDHTRELSYYDKKRIHNLKYFTWVEQQERKVEELNAQWHEHDTYWPETFRLVPKIDALIAAFNDKIFASGG